MKVKRVPGRYFIATAPGFAFGWVAGNPIAWFYLELFGRKMTVRPLQVFYLAWLRVRKLFPYFYSIALHDCDSGGRVFAVYVEWGLNWWHVQHRLKRWDGSGDGETYNRISFAEFVRAKRHIRKHGARRI